MKMRPAYGEALLSALRAGRAEVFNTDDEAFAGYQNDPAVLQVILKSLHDPKAFTRRLARLLDIDIALGGLHAVTEALEKKLDQLIQQRPELAEHVRTLEENYDQELFNTEMGDLKKWLLQQGIRLD